MTLRFGNGWNEVDTESVSQGSKIRYFVKIRAAQFALLCITLLQCSGAWKMVGPVIVFGQS